MGGFEKSRRQRIVVLQDCTIGSVAVDLIKSNKELGRLFINKLSAAERQLNSAIRMYFMEEDALAIHTIASASFNLYADLLRMRGKEPALHNTVYGLFRMARDHIDGRLSDAQLLELGESGLEAIKPMIDVLTKNPDFSIDSIEVSGSQEYIREYWLDKRKSYNFLKHADRDHDKLLDEAIINNEDIIVNAMFSSLHLNCVFSAEKELFYSAMFAFGFLEDPPRAPDMIWVLMPHSRDEVMHLCRKNLCYSRVDDDLCIDFEAAKEKSMTLLKERWEIG